MQAYAGLRCPESGSYSDKKLGGSSLELKYGFLWHIRVHAMPGGAETPGGTLKEERGLLCLASVFTCC